MWCRQKHRVVSGPTRDAASRLAQLLDQVRDRCRRLDLDRGAGSVPGPLDR